MLTLLAEAQTHASQLACPDSTPYLGHLWPVSTHLSPGLLISDTQPTNPTAGQPALHRHLPQTTSPAHIAPRCPSTLTDHLPTYLMPSPHFINHSHYFWTQRPSGTNKCDLPALLGLSKNCIRGLILDRDIFYSGLKGAGQVGLGHLKKLLLSPL